MALLKIRERQSLAQLLFYKNLYIHIPHQLPCRIKKFEGKQRMTHTRLVEFHFSFHSPFFFIFYFFCLFCAPFDFFAFFALTTEHMGREKTEAVSICLILFLAVCSFPFFIFYFFLVVSEDITKKWKRTCSFFQTTKSVYFRCHPVSLCVLNFTFFASTVFWT